MKKNTFLVFAFALLLGMPWITSAQEVNEEYNYNSLRPIRKSDMMYLNTLWWRMDMREKQNEAFFAEGNQITQIIVDAVKAGVLRPFTDDKLETRMSLNEFLENLKLPESGMDEDPIDGWPSEEEIWPDGDGTEPWTGEGSLTDGTTIEGAESAGDDEFLTKQMPILEIKTQLIFDKKRSRMYREVESITIVIPGDYYPSGIDKKLATFSYKELVENVFVDNPNATWYNSQNIVEHRNLADAFDLNLESAQLIRYANPRDAYIEDIYNGDLKVALGKSQEYTHGLLEKESNTWSN
ncbi:MAG: gliding motility protein GldN [Flammeovirgaceae bacterium]